jgi:hypothetical protein
MSELRSRPGKDLGPEDFEAIREAVMETSRGRWFLSEYEARLRQGQTAEMLDGMKRLETAVSHNHDTIMQRLAEALARGPVAAPPSASPPPQADLAPRHMKYFKQDEEIFEPAPQARIAAVPEAPKPAADTKPAVPKGAKLIIRRTGEATANAEAAPASPPPAAEAPAPAPAGEPQVVDAAMPPEPVPAPAEPVQAEAQPKRRIVIIRHKPGEDIDVPLQNEMAEAS